MSCDKCQGCKNKFESKSKNTVLPKITTLWLGLTEACNLKCSYCFVHQNPIHMSYELAVEGIDWIANQQEGGFHIQYFGGEPLLRWNEIIVPLTIYIEKTYPNRASIGITTNCILLDEEKLKFAKAHNIDVLFSIDGNKECQDINRPLMNGGSSFDVIKDKLPLILQYYPDATFRMTVDNKTVHTMYDNVKFAIETGFKNTFGAINQFPNWTMEELEEYERQYYKIADLFIDEVNKGNFLNINPMVKMFQKLYKVEHSSNRERQINASIGFGKCGIGSSGGTVLAPSGLFYSCQEVFTNAETRDHYLMGNIKDGVIDDLRHKIFKDVNPRLQRSSNEKMKCENCHVNEVCDGGCSVRNYDISRDHNIIPFPYCVSENILFEVCMYIKGKLKNNELFNERVKI